MLINQGETIYKGKDGKPTDSAEEGESILLAKGGSIDEAIARRHGIADRLTSHAEVERTNPVTGEPLVVVDGKAYAASLFEKPKYPWAKDEPRAEAKMVAAPAENKSAHAPRKADHKPADKP